MGTRQATARASALAPPPKIVELHPATVARYLARSTSLAATLTLRLVDGSDEAAGALRELIASIVIHPRKADREIEVTRRLAGLIGAPKLFPHGVSSGGSGEWDRTTDLRIMIPPL